MKEKIYVFGRGQYFDKKYEIISNQYDIVGFFDNAVTDCVIDSKYKLPVYNPSQIKGLRTYRIVLESKYFIEMGYQLLSYGINENRIIFGGQIEPYASEFEKSCFSRGSCIKVLNRKIVMESGGLITNIENTNQLTFELRKMARTDKHVSNLCNLPTVPYSRVFGTDRGTSIDRYYIEKFLNINKKYICGVVMEVGDNTYTKQFGGTAVKDSIILHVKGWGKNAIKGNFETGEGIHENMVDCLICTQTLQYIFDVQKAMRNIFQMLRPGGVALFTVPGIKSLCLGDAENWGERWSFTEESMRQMCNELGDGNLYYEINTYGNVKTAIGYLYGLCLEDLSKEDLEYNDYQFPFLITVLLQKRG